MPTSPQKPWKRKQDGAYYVQLNGKRIYLSKDKKTAWEKFRRIQQTGQAPSSLTARQLLDAYWKWLQANRAPETVKSREGILRSFGESVSATLKAESVRPHHVQTWIDANSKVKTPKNKRAKKEGKETSRPIADSTKNTRITLIIGVFSWAKRMRYIPENPLAEMPKPTPTTRQEFVPPDLWQKVLELALDDAFRDLLKVLLETGCRVTEIMRFEAEHFTGSTLVLPIQESKGKKRSRTVFLSDGVSAQPTHWFFERLWLEPGRGVFGGGRVWLRLGSRARAGGSCGWLGGAPGPTRRVTGA